MVKETNTSLLGSRLSRQFFIYTLMSIVFVEAVIAVSFYFLNQDETQQTFSDWGLSAVILIIATLIITLLTHKYFVRPILELKQGLLSARENLDGDGNNSSPHQGGNEIRQITHDINELINRVSEGSRAIQNTERKRKGLDEQFSAIFNSSFLPIILLDSNNYKILEANKATFDLLGFEESDLSNFSQDKFTSETLRGMKSFIDNVLDQGSGMNSELILQQKDGDEIPLEAYGSILKLADTPCVLLIARDKRPSIKAENELDLARKKAEYASQTKTNFLANMSHELRTPLTSINGFSKMIIDEAFGPIENEKYKEYVENILESGTHLLDIINDILDISRIEAGEMQLREQSVNFSDVANSCIKLVQNRAQKKNLTVTMELEDNLPMVWADQRLLKQITLNLLSNSLKFTKKGTVTLGAEMLTDDRFRFYVKDTGIGISVENIEKALQPFGQIDTGLAKHIDGSGLGLPLSQALTNLHGGVLEINSKEGAGTTVFVTLPASRIEWVD
jgi:PAS domain S-box-containing protein